MKQNKLEKLRFQWRRKWVNNIVLSFLNDISEWLKFWLQFDRKSSIVTNFSIIHQVRFHAFLWAFLRVYFNLIFISLVFPNKIVSVFVFVDRTLIFCEGFKDEIRTIRTKQIRLYWIKPTTCNFPWSTMILDFHFV